MSLFDRLIGRRRPWWVTAGIVALLYLASAAAAYADSGSHFLARDQWRGWVAFPTVVSYILILAPLLTAMDARVVQAFRPLVALDDSRYRRLVREASYVAPWKEALAFAAGVLFAVVSARPGGGEGAVWPAWYWVVAASLADGVVAWTLYATIASTRLNASLIHQPLRVHPIDIGPFEVIGRQSLLLALVFAGGITLSLLLFGPGPGNTLSLEFWVLYSALTLVPLLTFYLNVYPTHRVLAAAKARELSAVRAHLAPLSRGMLERLDRESSLGDLPAELSALLAYEQRLQVARTWPYDTGTLQALAISALIPVLTALVQVLAQALFS